jgi:hypothetical protein
MIVESPHWRVIRRIGIGDREHVRHGLLSVGIFHKACVLDAMKGAFMAADELFMMARAHINVNRLPLGLYAPVIELMHRHGAHQLIEHGNLELPLFKDMFETLDLIVEPLTEPNAEDLKETILMAWKAHGGRFLEGNFARSTKKELQTRYPALHPDPLPHHEVFLNAAPL